MISHTKRIIAVGFFALIALAVLLTGRGTAIFAAPESAPQDAQAPAAAPAAQADPAKTEKMEKKGAFDSAQKQDEADRKSAGCVSCHTYDKESEPLSMHPFGPANIGCADCHGGDFGVMRPEGGNRGDKAFDEAKHKAHVQPLHPEWF